MSDASVEAFARRWWRGELGAVGAVLDGVLSPAEVGYRAMVALRNAGYDRGTLAAHRAGLPVISIGNLAVGGAGKTPFAHWVARRLAGWGARPAILHGGYAADEPALHRAWSAAIPVIVARDRVLGAQQARAAGATVAVLDDAFQHRRLWRDLDIVLVAAESWTRTPRLLPRGPWREPPHALARADIVVCTRKAAAQDVAAGVTAQLGASSGRPVVQVALRARAWRHAGAPAQPPPDAGVLVAALAEPGIFEENARAAGADVAERLLFPDHHAYTEADISRIQRAGRSIITTEKDWVKLAGRIDADRVWLLTQAVEVESGADTLDAALRRVLP